MTRNQNRNPDLPAEGFAPVTRKGRVGEVAAWCIALISWSISYVTQVALAVQHGFHGWIDLEAYGEGLLADLASLAMMCIALDQAERGRPAKLTWLFSILAALVMEWANIVYAWGDPVAVLLHAWPPFLAVGIIFVLVHTRRMNTQDGGRPPFPPEPEPEPEPPAPLPPPPPIELSVQAEPEPKPAPVEPSEPNGRERVTLARATREYRKLAAKGRVTGSALGAALGVSDVMGRNWKRKVEAEAKPVRPFRFQEEVAA